MDFHNTYNRVALAHAPTPLEPMPNLTAALGGPTLYVKRDDCTGLALGGNKARQLEYYLGAAVAQNADTILITGAVQSNFVRQAAAAARKLGMAIHIQLEERVGGQGELYQKSGNVVLDRLLGAVIHRFPVGEDEAAADANLERIATGLRAQGWKPYIIHLGTDHPPLGALGYVDAALEFLQQLTALQLEPDAVIVPSGSAATHSGFLAGLRLGSSDLAVHGVCVRRDAASQHARMRQRVTEVGGMIGLGKAVPLDQVLVEDTWLGPGYGSVTPAVIEAMELAARTEGLILDPVYSARTMAGLIGMVRRGDFQPGQTVVFLHTGGAPALFGYAQFTEDR